MTPEVEATLAKAAEDLGDARKIMTIPLPKAAARSAYYAAFHATEALLLARIGRIAKTHTGLRTALAKLLHGTSGEDRALLTFLARAYKYKELSDYGIGRSAGITEDEANALIEEAARFLERMATLIAEADGGPGEPAGGGFPSGTQW